MEPIGVIMNDKDLMYNLRKELGLTQSEMAKEAGYNSKDAISKIERGKKGLSGPARKCLHYIAQHEGITTNSE